jgi:hypothetical protein
MLSMWQLMLSWYEGFFWSVVVITNEGKCRFLESPKVVTSRWLLIINEKRRTVCKGNKVWIKSDEKVKVTSVLVAVLSMQTRKESAQSSLLPVFSLLPIFFKETHTVVKFKNSYYSELLNTVLMSCEYTSRTDSRATMIMLNFLIQFYCHANTRVLMRKILEILQMTFKYATEARYTWHRVFLPIKERLLHLLYYSHYRAHRRTYEFYSFGSYCWHQCMDKVVWEDSCYAIISIK